MTSSQSLNRLKANVDAVRRRMEAACQRAGRSASDVTLVAVTKYVSVEVAARLPELGIRDLGESRPQELWHKASALPDVRWHLIGHLQRNKVDSTIPLTSLIHSVDSERLLVAIQAAASQQNRPVPVLLEVNVSGESAKQGFAPSDVPSVLARFTTRFPQLSLRGLMTMAPLSADPEQVRPVFRELRRLRDQWRGDFPLVGSLAELSMGMTQDFEVAIEEGATMVRVGSALFEGCLFQ